MYTRLLKAVEWCTEGVRGKILRFSMRYQLTYEFISSSVMNSSQPMNLCHNVVSELCCPVFGNGTIVHSFLKCNPSS